MSQTAFKFADRNLSYIEHKARYLDTHAPRDLRIESGEWLLDQGFVGLDGKQILPFGEPPQ
jgi:hypothetical protein